MQKIKFERNEKNRELLEATFKMIYNKLCDEAENKKMPQSMEAFSVLARCMYLVRNWCIQDKHIDDDELDWIRFTRKAGFSIGQLAYICDRSKSTIHDALNRTPNDAYI